MRRAESPLGPPAGVCATAIVICIATALEGAAARGVAAGPPCGRVRYCHCDLRSNGSLHSLYYRVPTSYNS